MSSDPIVAEIRRIREAYAARFGYDIHAIVKDAQQRDALGDRVVVRRPPRRPIPVVPINAGVRSDASTDKTVFLHGHGANVTIETIREWLNRRPFEPFVVKVSNGEAYEVHRPENIIVLKSRLILGYPETDCAVHVALIHVNSIEAPQTA